MSDVDWLDLPEDPDDRSSRDFVTWLDELGQATNEDALFAILAAQRPPRARLARQQIRGRLVKVITEKLKEFGSRASPAKTADAWLQEGGGAGDETLQGSAFVAETIDPWDEPVAGADVLDEVAAIFDAYVFTSADGLAVLALWAAFTHLYDCFGVAPLLDLSSPTKRCGKSTAVVVMRHLCNAPLLSGNITPAALFRAIEAWKPTLLIDEADTFARMNDELRGIINSGHTRDTAFVIRAEGEAYEPRVFSTWAPKLVAAIGRLPDTIEDRSIRLVLTRKPTSISKRDAFDGEMLRGDCQPVRRRLIRFTLDNLDEIANAGANIERSAALHDRAWNNWRPLLAIAAAAGGDWPTRAAHAALTLAGASDDGDVEDVSTLALQHVWETIKTSGRLSTEEIVRLLITREDGPWAKWWEPAIAKNELKSPAAKLARLLKPFGIKPRQLWIDGSNQRGYDAADFTTATVAVYLEEEARDARDTRRGSSSQATSSVASNPSDLSECSRRSFTILGDDGFLDVIESAFTAGTITHRERHDQRLLHLLAFRTREPTAASPRALEGPKP